MWYHKKKIILKNGKIVFFRSPMPLDASKMVDFLKTCASETLFILRYPEEFMETVEQEATFLEAVNTSETSMMITCIIDGEIAGNCQIIVRKNIKTKHRASVTIAIIQKYWGIGIGSAMFKEMISIAKEQRVLQLELDYIEGNERAKKLYEKMGFVQSTERENAIRLKNGQMLKEYSMIKKI